MLAGFSPARIRKPSAADRYGYLGEHQKMPGFAADQLSENDVNMVIRYLRGDYLHRTETPVAESSPAPTPTQVTAAASR